MLEAEASYTLSRLKILEQLPGNPIGVAYRRIGEAGLAMMARHLPSPSFNSARGLRAVDVHELRPLVEWYRDGGVSGRFEMVPGDYGAALGQELGRLGYYQSEFHVAMYGVPDQSPAVETNVEVDLVTSPAMMEEYLDAYVRGWGIPEPHHDRFKANVRPWLGQPGWSLYVGRIDGKAAAAAILYVDRGVAYLADATTDPAFRGRGFHAALLARRLRDADGAGADLACSGAAFLSTSHRNMERVGLRVLFTRAIWTPFPKPALPV
ncbi:MAG TPA: GNAT family N-acetyltransferase [Stellaceae bacterium]|nr:GNAT family N-acetyltransferase [Stellaceae bacterium]